MSEVRNPDANVSSFLPSVAQTRPFLPTDIQKDEEDGGCTQGKDIRTSDQKLRAFKDKSLYTKRISSP
jgi:hypothetical protein